MRQTHKTCIEVFAHKIEGSEGATGREDGAAYLVGEISYSKGGTNYFTGNVHKRGYTARVQVRERGRSENGITWESFTIGNSIGRAEFLEETKSFSQKKLEAYANSPTIRAILDGMATYALTVYQQRKAKESHAVAV